MKRSAQVILVISGAILNGCSPQREDWDSDSSQVLTNNTYVPGSGYYHAPYHTFFPFPYNSFQPGRGYYHGGRYTDEPDRSAVGASAPRRTGSDRGGFTRSSSSRSGSFHITS